MYSVYCWLHYIPPLALRPNAGHGLIILEVSRSYTAPHRHRQDFSGRVTSPSQRPLPDNTTFNTDIHAPGGIRTHNPSKRAAVDPRLRPRGHWDRHTISVTDRKNLTVQFPTAKPLWRSQSYSWVTDNISISEQPLHSRPVSITPR